MPTLIKFLKRVFLQCSTPILCMVVSQLLKFVSPTMALVQRAISVLLYGNSASKQVSTRLACFKYVLSIFSQLYNCLRPIKQLTEGYGSNVLKWQDGLEPSKLTSPMCSTNVNHAFSSGTAGSM